MHTYATLSAHGERGGHKLVHVFEFSPVVVLILQRHDVDKSGAWVVMEASRVLGVHG